MRAFRTAGARHVLMALWSVRDTDAEAFMTAFYDRWFATGPQGDPAMALRATQLEFLNDQRRAERRDPKVWAPYVLVRL